MIYDQASAQIIEMPIEELQSMESQPRQYFDEESLTGLTENIRRNGVVIPLLITKDKKIIAGERRYRAAKAAGFESVPVIYKDENIYEIAVLDNIMREGLTVVEKAEALKKLYGQLKAENQNLKQEKFGEAYQFRKASISEYFAIANMNSDIRDMFRNEPDAAYRKLKAIAAMKNKPVQQEKTAKVYKESLAKKEERVRSSKPDAAIKKVNKFIEDLKSLPEQWKRNTWKQEEQDAHIEKLRELQSEINKVIEKTTNKHN